MGEADVDDCNVKTEGDAGVGCITEAKGEAEAGCNITADGDTDADAKVDNAGATDCREGSGMDSGAKERDAEGKGE